MKQKVLLVISCINLLSSVNVLAATSSSANKAATSSTTSAAETKKNVAITFLKPNPPRCPVIYYPGAFVGSKTTLFLTLPPTSSMARVLAALAEQEPDLKMHALYKIINPHQFDPRPLSSFNEVNNRYGMIALTEVEHRAHKEQWLKEAGKPEDLRINLTYFST